MKIMSFNTQHCLNFLTQKIDYPKMAETIKEFSPDIVGLNEMRDTLTMPEYDRQTEILASLSGYEYHAFAKAIEISSPEPYSYGNGFLSRYKIVSKETFRIALPEEERSSEYYESRVLMKLRLENGYTVLVTHFGLSRAEHIEAVRVILRHIEPEKCILMGDFNVRPENDILLPLREKMTDCASASEGENFTFPSTEPNRKIDYIFVSRDLKVKSFRAENRIASDHLPVTAEIEE